MQQSHAFEKVAGTLTQGCGRIGASGDMQPARSARMCLGASISISKL